MATSAIENDLRRLMARTLGEAVPEGNVRREDLKGWDSLRHVELIFELEEHFGIQIAPEAIVELYSDTDTVLQYLAANVRSGA